MKKSAIVVALILGSMLSPAHAGSGPIKIVLPEEADLLEPCMATRSNIGRIIMQNVNETLTAGSRGSTAGGGRLRAGLLVAEVALSLVLLIAAGLLLSSFARLQRVDPGFEPDGVFTAQNLPGHGAVPKPDQLEAYALGPAPRGARHAAE